MSTGVKPLIYCVDDDKSIRDFLSLALEMGSFEAQCFDGAAPFYEAIKAKKPDLILLDVMMDGDDGYTVISKIKANIDTRDIPVIFLSAKESEGDKVKGLDLGADDFIEKPFGVMELIARIKASLRKSSKESDTIVYKSLSMDLKLHRFFVGGEEKVLTRKEFDLLRYFLLNTDRVLKKEDVFVSVWKEEQVESRSLDVYIARLNKIIGPDCHINTIRGVGVILE